MNQECAYSFTDLYIAAMGRKPDKKEARDMSKLSLKRKNELIRILAAKADWETIERIGTDDRVYVAFAPEFDRE